MRNGLRGNRNCVSDEVPREKGSSGDLHTWKSKILQSTISCSGSCMRHGQEYWLGSRPVVIFDSRPEWAVVRTRVSREKMVSRRVMSLPAGKVPPMRIGTKSHLNLSRRHKFVKNVENCTFFLPNIDNQHVFQR